MTLGSLSPERTRARRWAIRRAAADEEVTGPDRWIADGQAEDGSFGVWARLCFVEECVQAGFEEAVDQRGRGVVSTGCLTFVAGQGVEREGPS